MNEMGTQTPQVYFGGGSRSPGLLRDMLESRVRAMPPGGEICWLTYYFRDLRLARALIDAARRGVMVTLTIDGRPRTADANREVIRLFEEEKEKNLRFSAPKFLFNCFRLHTKLYYFSHPRPVAFIGSFNPSGNSPEKYPAIIEEIGDHDRGFNLLVGVEDEKICQELKDYCKWVNSRPIWWIPYLSPPQHRTLMSAAMEISFLPSLFPHPLFSFLDRLDSSARLRIAASHLKGWPAKKLLRLASKGCHIEIVAESTERRVPRRYETYLKDAGIYIKKAGFGWKMPMHDKFTLISWKGRRYSYFGSFNWTTGSMVRNLEIVARSTDPLLYETFSRRWQELSSFAASPA